jgi:hypothetical protein
VTLVFSLYYIKKETNRRKGREGKGMGGIQGNEVNLEISKLRLGKNFMTDCL